MGTLLGLRQIVILSLMILVGYLGNLWGILGRDAQKWLTKVVLNICCPCMIINSVTTSQRLESMTTLLLIFATAISYYVFLPFLGKIINILLRIPSDHRPEYEAMLIFSNLGFMGIPVMNAVLGQESILYLSIFMAMYNVAVFGYGRILLRDPKSQDSRIDFMQMINVGSVSSLFAVLLYLLGITLPDLILEPVASLGNSTTPMAMLVIGASLANSPFLEMIRAKGMLLFSALKLLVLPLIFLGIGRLLLKDELLIGVMVLVTAMPVGSNVVMIGAEQGRDADYVAKGIFFTTLLSIITIPVISALL